jgi:hypothetical protein
VSCTHILDDKPTYRDTLTAADSRLGLRHATSHARSVSTRRDRLSHRLATRPISCYITVWLVYMNMTYGTQAIVITVSYSSESRGPAVVLAQVQTRSRAHLSFPRSVHFVQNASVPHVPACGFIASTQSRPVRSRKIAHLQLASDLRGRRRQGSCTRPWSYWRIREDAVRLVEVQTDRRCRQSLRVAGLQVAAVHACAKSYWKTELRAASSSDPPVVTD